jgi:hypothetical protein
VWLITVNELSAVQFPLKSNTWLQIREKTETFLFAKHTPPVSPWMPQRSHNKQTTWTVSFVKLYFIRSKNRKNVKITTQVSQLIRHIISLRFDRVLGKFCAFKHRNYCRRIYHVLPDYALKLLLLAFWPCLLDVFVLNLRVTLCENFFAIVW